MSGVFGMMRSLAIAFVLANFLAINDSRPQPAPADALNAPIYYGDQGIVITNEHGIAVLKFNSTKDGDKVGAHYHYRLLSPDGKETSGEGDVYENYKQPAGGGPIVDLGSKTVVEVDEMKLTWSRGADQFGWIYYVPEEMTVQIVKADLFDNLDLNRFKK